MRQTAYTRLRHRVVWLLVVPLLPSTSTASIIFVDRSATGSIVNGTTWCAAFRDLQDGLAAAQPGDEIRVANGVYRPDRSTGYRFATFTLKSGVALKGGYAGCGAANPDARDPAIYPARLTGDLLGDDGLNFVNYEDNSYHVVTYDNPSATSVLIEGFTIAGGNADGPDGLTNQGGGIHIRQGLAKCLPGGPTIRDCVIERCFGHHHGAINDHGLSTVIENCIIRYNHSEEQGGGLQVHSGAPTIRNCTFLGNISDGQGGGAWVGTDTDPSCSGPSTATFTDCTFEDNTARWGGGMFQDLGTAPTLIRCVFRQNRAVATASRGTPDAGRGDPSFVQGGGVWFKDNTPTMIDCQFIENTSATHGGGIWGAFGAPIFDGCVWEGNYAEEGGGLYHAGMNLTASEISNCVFRNNRAFILGGGLSAYGTAPFINNTLFEGNHCDHYGGGAAIATQFSEPCNGDWCNSTQENCTYRGNSAPRGGGIYIYYAPRLTFKNVLFEGNGLSPAGASAYGGGMHIDGRSTPPYSDSERASVVDVLDCTFRANYGAFEGGALRTEFGTNVTIVRTDFLGNFSGGRAGAILTRDYSRVRIFNSRFVANNLLASSYSASGGAIVASSNFGTGVELTVANTLFAGNSSRHDAGALLIENQSTATIANSTFTQNESVQSGGALVATDSSVEVFNSILWSNPSGSGGGIAGDMTVTHSIVDGGWPGAGNANADPQFDDPLGPDGLPGTLDDELHVAISSPAINAADISMLPADLTDLDDDGDITEPLPLDLVGVSRILGAGLDMGALETTVIDCPPGQFSPTGEQPCTPCDPGSAQPNSGATACNPCAAGTFASSSGATACSPCAPSTFQPSPGAVLCMACGNCDDGNGCTEDGCNAVSGACENVEICTIPAASAWGLSSLAILLLIGGTLAISRPVPNPSACPVRNHPNGLKSRFSAGFRARNSCRCFSRPSGYMLG